MSLTLRQVEDKCLYGKGPQQCRFLAEDDMRNFFCIKQTSQKAVIDAEVDIYKQNLKAKGIDPDDMSIPIGDNCKGYIFFKHKKQGYDLDKK